MYVAAVYHVSMALIAYVERVAIVCVSNSRRSSPAVQSDDHELPLRRSGLVVTSVRQTYDSSEVLVAAVDCPVIPSAARRRSVRAD